MFFKKLKISSDTCGNSQSDGEPEYYQAESLRKLWDFLGQPKIFGYTLPNRKTINKSRTPKGQGYGTWELNPNYDQEYGLDNAIALDGAVFPVGFIIVAIQVRKV
jgi:hypothetical protein